MFNHVLIVDDEPKNIQLLGSTLRSKSYDVSFAESGAEALKSIELNPPDIILLDINMPEMDGFEVCKRLKESKFSSIPIIFLTANNDSDTIDLAFKLGAVDYITKPYRNSELLNHVATHLKLQQAIEEADSANKTKTSFLANMSHEIRTPMNAILGFTEILKSQETDKQKIHYMESIHSAGKELLCLINDILDITKVEAGKIELQYSPVSLTSLFKEIEEIFRQKSKHKGLELSSHFAEDLPTALILDETRLRQILINLIDNALKFTEKGFIRLSVECHFSEKTHSQVNLLLKVKDSGMGIPVSQMGKIFNAFEQADDQKVKDYGGTGLGLAISKQLAELMNGTVTVKSEYGKGATFIVNLFAVEVAAGSLEYKENGVIDYDNLVFENASILIVDDIDFNREVLRSFLDGFGFEFSEAADGKDALEQVYEKSPDLILLDMKMPVMNGYDVVKELNHNAALSKIPVIAVTASALTHNEKIISELCDGYLRKPVSKAQLIGEVMKYLKHEFKETVSCDKQVNGPLVTEDIMTAKQLNKLMTYIQPFLDALTEYPGGVNEIAKLNNAFQEAVHTYPNSNLTNWQLIFQSACDDFDIHAIDLVLKTWPEVIKRLQKTI